MIKKFFLTVLFACVIYGSTSANSYWETIPADSVMAKLLKARIASLKSIPVNTGTDHYYVRLMQSLYEGANELIKAQVANGNAIINSEQSESLQKYHNQMNTRFAGFMAVKSQGTPVSPRFKMMSEAALQHFSRFEFQRYQKKNTLLPALLIEFYENMDQLSVAFVSAGVSKRLKELAWETVEKQNNLIDLLKKRL